jgi:NADH-quinone oxidoreductase subunit G
MPENETLTMVLDGRHVPAHKGEKIIAAAERAGTYIPRFCYHPRMRPVGMCRMCLVEVKGPRGFSLQPACFMDVSDGMEVVTTTDKVRKAQDGILEFLLVNHPLDCPVCDKGGECPLQDQTLTYGPGESRFVEEKRHWAKPIYISRLVALDRERCIQCDRCTRFATEVAGEPLINFISRGDHIEVNTFPGLPFDSYFSGNTVQICPVGALTAAPYRFKARPWDLEQCESTCTSCAVGCRVAVQSSSNRVIRYLGVDADPVNHGWLCDKGRFDFEANNSEVRVTQPLLRQDQGLQEVSWGRALASAAQGMRRALDRHGPSGVGVIGGARLTNEDAYAWAKLAKSVLRTDSVDAQLGDGLPAEVVLGLPRATINEACSARALVLLAPDLHEELPILHLRLRQAVMDRGLPLVELAPAASGLTTLAKVSLSYRPGEAAELVQQLLWPHKARSAGPSAPTDADAPARQARERARQLLGLHEGGKGEGVVVVLGRPSLAEPAASIAAAVSALAEALPAARFLPALRRANVHGALDMGLAPGLLPGRVTLEGGRDWFTGAWGALPDSRGQETAGMLAAAAEGRMGALVLLGSDPLADFPDRRLARRALDGVELVVAVDAFLNESSRRADVVLPAAMYAERAGTTTNLEGRITRLGQKVVAPGTCRPDWMIAAELAAAMGADLGLESVEEIWDEIERLAPSHAGITRFLLADRSSRDGLLAPLPKVPVRIQPGVGRPGGGPAVHPGSTDTGAGATQGVPAPIDPMATPGIGSAERHGVPNVAGAPEDWSTEQEREAWEGPERGVSDQEKGSEEDAVSRPNPLSYSGPAVAPDVPRVDGYGLRLVTGRVLFDRGTLVQACPSLAPLAPGPRLRVNRYDLDRLGRVSGDRVRVVTPGASLVAEAVVDPGIPRGSAALAFNLEGEGAADLIDATKAVTDVRLETI